MADLKLGSVSYEAVSSGEKGNASKVPDISFYPSDLKASDNRLGDLDTLSNDQVRQRLGGRASQFLENKGFGWLMEVEEDESDSGRPLL